MKQLAYINLSYCCFGIIVQDGICIQVPPIAKWMEAERITKIIAWVKKKNGTIKIRRGEDWIALIE